MSQFELFANKLKSSHVAMTDSSLPVEFLLERNGETSIYYAPFDYVNTKAKIVICGITPGFQQAVLSINEAKEQLIAGASIDQAKKRAKEVASFGGAMRKNLTDMLDCIGVHKKLRIDSCSTLFSENSHLVHYTSALRYPVFVKGENYSGSPNMISNKFLKTILEKYLIDEVKMLSSECLYVPLGPAVTEVFSFLVNTGTINASQVLEGLPHPSGANAERISYFLGRKKKEDLSIKTNSQKLDEAKEYLIRKLA